MQQRLQREKTEQIKNLLAEEEMVKQYQDDMLTKLRSEKDNYDTLLRDKMLIVERLTRRQAQLEKDKKTVEEQDAELARLEAEINAEREQVETLTEEVTEAKEVNRREGEKNRQLQQDHTPSEAEYEFIETHYDYNSNVQAMDTNLFSNVVKSNSEVNETVNDFLSKVDNVQKEFKKIVRERRVR